MRLRADGPRRIAGMHLHPSLEGAWLADLGPAERRSRSLRACASNASIPAAPRCVPGCARAICCWRSGDLEIPHLLALSRALRHAPEPLDLVVRRGRALLRVRL
ncbi:MAG: hypothetical protein RML12_01725 [Xanthomonadales bacterium]|nr:hypothetical protein [Xanthomonadales bacterium]